MSWAIILNFFLGINLTPGITVNYDAKADVLVFKGLSLAQEALDQSISVYFGTDIGLDQPQVLGSFEKKGRLIFFKAKYGFTPGSSYTVLVQSYQGKNKVDEFNNSAFRHIISIPAIDRQPTTFIRQVYPTADQLPMNQLKFYVEFSAPMRQGNAFDHIQLYRLPEGIPEKEAFLSTPEELWDPSHTRLTLFFDPGRIKRGVQPNLQLGLPLVKGRRYKFVIDQKWMDANGAQLISGFEKEFSVIEVDRQSPNPESWRVHPPAAETKDELMIDFGESMDFGLLHSTLTVQNTLGNKLQGSIRLDQEESRWLFLPQKDWEAGDYQILVNPWLEDLAGNNLRRKFDVNLNDPRDQPRNMAQVNIPFQISSEQN